MSEHIKGYVLYRYDDTGLDGEFESMVDSVVIIRSDHKIEDFTEEDNKINDIVYPERHKWDKPPVEIVPIRDGDDLICRLKKAGYDASYLNYSTVELPGGDNNGDKPEDESED